jgi:hypothetical protein
MGLNTYRAAGIVQALRDLGREVVDEGNISPPSPAADHSRQQRHQGSAASRGLDLGHRRYGLCAWADTFPVFTGGLQPVGRHPHRTGAKGRGDGARCSCSGSTPTDFHTLTSTHSGNLYPDRLCDQSARFRGPAVSSRSGAASNAGGRIACKRPSNTGCRGASADRPRRRPDTASLSSATRATPAPVSHTPPRGMHRCRRAPN